MQSSSDIDINKQVVQKSGLNLDRLREELIRQEETIIFAIIERAQWKLNSVVYQSGGIKFNVRDDGVKKDGKLPSFLDFFFAETEKVHALVRRYTSPDEHPFYPNSLPEPILPFIDFPMVLKPNTVNINDKIKSTYLDKFLPLFCEAGNDSNYGSTATCDIAVLQALSKRIHYGKYVAEAKFQSAEAEYTKLIERGDIPGINEKLTNIAVEEKLLKRVYKKASTYGQDSESPEEKKFKVQPELIVSLYKDFIIPLTKEAEVLYLLQRLQGPSVSFLGPLGTFSQQAAIEYLEMSTANSKANVNFVPCGHIGDVFTNVVSNKTIFGIVPIENSQTGIIRNHLDTLVLSDTKVCGELYLPISFSLMSNAPVNTIKKIYSHAQGLEQCRKWLRIHFPDAELVAAPSTAKAAEMASTEEGTAAVANKICADIYKLKILEEEIQDSSTNTTRFLVISRSFGDPSGKDKSIVTFSAGHTPGALMNSLAAFQSNGVNLTSIQSFVDKSSNFNYSFYIEFEGHVKDEGVGKSLALLTERTTTVKIIGSFPQKDQNVYIKPKPRQGSFNAVENPMS